MLGARVNRVWHDPPWVTAAELLPPVGPHWGPHPGACPESRRPQRRRALDTATTLDKSRQRPEVRTTTTSRVARNHRPEFGGIRGGGYGIGPTTDWSLLVVVGPPVGV